MSEILDDTEKAQLATALRKPALRKAISHLLDKRARDRDTFERAALAQAFNEGRDKFVDELYELASPEGERPDKVGPRRLKHIGVGRV